MDTPPLTAAPTQSEICALRIEFARRLKARMRTYSLDKKAIERRSFELVVAGELKRGINRTNLYPLLDGRQLPNRDTLDALAKVLQCQPEDLVPNVGAVQTTRGRRRIRINRALVACKRTGIGLEHARLQLDVVLPSNEAMAICRVFRTAFRTRGMELDPPAGPNSVDYTPLDVATTAEVLRDLIDPKRRTR